MGKDGEVGWGMEETEPGSRAGSGAQGHRVGRQAGVRGGRGTGRNKR